jgi:alkylation response protein AidB-like acyl-CoA dehydrogenase
MGRYMLPGPYFSNVVLGGMSIMDSGTEEQKQEYLPRIAEGQIIVTLALNEPSGRWDAEGIQLTADGTGDEYTLNGTKLFVPNAHISDYIVVAARTGNDENDISLFIVPSQSASVKQTLLKTIASDRQSEVTFDNVEVPSSSLLGEKNRGWETIEKVLKWGAIGKCAEMSGGGQSVLDISAHLPIAPHLRTFSIVSQPRFFSPKREDDGTSTLSKVTSDCLSDAIVFSKVCLTPADWDGTMNRLMSFSSFPVRAATTI